jgi:hypothetical protein
MCVFFMGMQNHLTFSRGFDSCLTHVYFPAVAPPLAFAGRGASEGRTAPAAITPNVAKAFSMTARRDSSAATVAEAKAVDCGVDGNWKANVDFWETAAATDRNTNKLDAETLMMMTILKRMTTMMCGFQMPIWSNQKEMLWPLYAATDDVTVVVVL